MSRLPGFFADDQGRVDEELRRLMPRGTERRPGHAAGPFEQVGPVLTLLAAELCGGSSANALVAACAVEWWAEIGEPLRPLHARARASK